MSKRCQKGVKKMSKSEFRKRSEREVNRATAVLAPSKLKNKEVKDKSKRRSERGQK